MLYVYWRGRIKHTAVRARGTRLVYCPLPEMTHVTILAFEVPPLLLSGPITRPPPLPTPRDQPLQWQKLIPRQGRLVPLPYWGITQDSPTLGRPVSVPAVPDICHIGRNGSRATPRLKITTISLSHSIAALPVLSAWRVQGSAKRRGLGCVNSLPGSAWL